MADAAEPPEPTSLELPDNRTEPPPAATELELPNREIERPEPASPEAAPASPTGPLGNLVAAHLQRVEIAMLSRILATTLAGALPASMVRVERRRTLGQRLGRRPGPVIGVSVTVNDKTLTFRSPAVGVTEATVSHTVRGVALSTTQITVAEWLDQLAAILNAASDTDDATRAALQRALLT